MTSATLSVASTSERPRRNYEMADVHHLASRIMLYLLVFTAVSVVGFPLLWMVFVLLQARRRALCHPADLPAEQMDAAELQGPVRADELSNLLRQQPCRRGRRHLSLAPDRRLGRLQPEPLQASSGSQRSRMQP